MAVGERDPNAIWTDALGWQIPMSQGERFVEVMTGPDAAKVWRDRAIALAAECDRLRAERLKLDRRIHNQRRANRETWEIVDQRWKGMGSQEGRRRYLWLLGKYRELRERVR